MDDDIARKMTVNVRAWGSRKLDLERQLTLLLGVPWRITADPTALLAHAPSDDVRVRLGDCMVNYAQGALYQLGRYAAEYGAVGVLRLNALVPRHVLALQAFAPNPAYDTHDVCCTCGVGESGCLVVIIMAPRMGLNPMDALAPVNLERALQLAAAAVSSSAENHVKREQNS